LKLKGHTKRVFGYSDTTLHCSNMALTAVIPVWTGCLLSTASGGVATDVIVMVVVAMEGEGHEGGGEGGGDGATGVGRGGRDSAIAQFMVLGVQ